MKYYTLILKKDVCEMSDNYLAGIYFSDRNSLGNSIHDEFDSGSKYNRLLCNSLDVLYVLKDFTWQTI